MTQRATKGRRFKKRPWAWMGLLFAAAIASAALFLPRSFFAFLRPEPRATEKAFSEIPRIDVHTHFPPDMAEGVLETMDRHGVRIVFNASGGTAGSDTLEASSKAAQRTGGRARFYCSVDFTGVEHPRWSEYVEAALDTCQQQGASGLKIFKSLGLGVTLQDGSLLAVDDPRLDPVFEGAGRRNLPVLIHSGDPQAFFRPLTPDNERYEELQAHPSWSFYGEREDTGRSWPTWEEVFTQYERRVARHPNTTFVGAHFGNAPEEPKRVAEMLRRNPHYVVETGARIPEIGRHPAAEMRKLFIQYADRILFGTDFQVGSWGLALGSMGTHPDPPSRIAPFFRSHWRYFETTDRNFPHPTPIQGRWTIDGLNLPKNVLQKLYWKNAARVFQTADPFGS